MDAAAMLAMLLPTRMVMRRWSVLRLSRAIAFAPRVFDSRSALVLAWFMETSAISEPEKNAESPRQITKRAMLRLSIIFYAFVGLVFCCPIYLVKDS